jgi:hypothetical protein
MRGFLGRDVNNARIINKKIANPRKKGKRSAMLFSKRRDTLNIQYIHRYTINETQYPA